MTKKKTDTTDLAHVVLYSAIVAVILYAGWALSVAYEHSASTTPPPVQPSEPIVACTMDAKICADGSAVGRIGPSCEFAPCPNE